MLLLLLRKWYAIDSFQQFPDITVSLKSKKGFRVLIEGSYSHMRSVLADVKSTDETLGKLNVSPEV